MRFHADGPPIPDELLVARDEGRVVLFCGAGVSRARACLPGFFGLAEKVVEILGAAADGPAQQIIAQARELEAKPGLAGLISADRVFGLLEAEFLEREVAAAVAKALKPAPTADLSAHRIILDLARGPDKKVRLVTTNFDLLFEACDADLPRWQPPRLPDPKRPEEFEGIVHLHGRVDDDYGGAHGDGFVLSSAEFGRAYLSEGWATAFMRSILNRYFIVFIGYTADDPPVQYLLEALKRGLEPRCGVYAFQAGSPTEAKSKWGHKGVEAIAYDDTDGHRALWETLQSWAARARDPEAWYDATISLAQKGPAALAPCQRSQVAHVVSTLHGARKFAASDEPPPADWLCVFDPRIRFATPAHIYSDREQGPLVNPHHCFGLDSDPSPPDIDPADQYTNREVPDGVWDCFSPTRLDRENLGDAHLAALRGHWAASIPRLPARLGLIAAWIAKVSNQPAAVWWAAQQSALHPEIQSLISYQLESLKKPSPPEVRKAWRLLFASWEAQESQERTDFHYLMASVALDGWSDAAIRKLARLQRGYIKTSTRLPRGPLPPQSKRDISLSEMLHVDVAYLPIESHAKIPDSYLVAAARDFRSNLEHAVRLESDLGGYGLYNLTPIERDERLERDSFGRSYGIARAFFAYLGILKRLAETDGEAARREFQAWRQDDAHIFARLRIWAAGERRILSASEAARLLCGLEDDVFWDRRHQRDLLLVLSKRWADLPDRARRRLGVRMLRGRPPWKGEKKTEYLQRRAWLSLDRVHWLAGKGCRFFFDLETETSRLRSQAPDWQPVHAQHAADSTESVAGWVRTETACSALLAIPLSDVLKTAADLSGRTREFLVENDPFAGLAAERPVRALGALTAAGRLGEYPEWAWRRLLTAQTRKADRPKFSALIAERLARIPDSTFMPVLYAASEWLLVSAEALFESYPHQFGRLWSRLVSALTTRAPGPDSSLVRSGRTPDWATEALNAPAGKLVEALMKDPLIKPLQSAHGFPPVWIKRVNELLALSGDQRRHTLVLLAFNLRWLFAIDPEWTERNLLCIFEENGDDQDAMWAGFFWGATVPNKELYMRMKPHLLRRATDKRLSKSSHTDTLAGILLAGWGSVDESGNRFITSPELRNALLRADDHFRSHTLWQLERWAAASEETWSEQQFEFLSTVWPRQKQAKSPQLSAQLCNLAFSHASSFPRIVDLVIPLVTKADQNRMILPSLRRSRDNIVDRHPEKTLALLSAVLPESAALWPYEIEQTIDRMGTADPSLLTDQRMLDLRRRWNAR